MTRRAWSAEEVDLLKERSASSPLKELATELGRTVKMVRWKAHQLGLEIYDSRRDGSGAPRTVWTEEKEAYVREHASFTPVRFIADALGVTEKSVRALMYDRQIAGRGLGSSRPPETIAAMREKAASRLAAKYPPEGPWVCLTCKVSKPLSDYTFTERRADHVCRSCQRERWIKSAYGITSAQYDQMLTDQGGVCAICKHPEARQRSDGEVFSLSVDHDHACCPGRKTCGACLRGLLCWECNNLLGKIEAVPGRLNNTASYLSAYASR